MNTETSERITHEEKERTRKRLFNYNKYHNNTEFRQKEIERTGARIKKVYSENQEVRQRMIDNAKARYYRLKEEKKQTTI